jgi:protein SCO1/2
LRLREEANNVTRRWYWTAAVLAVVASPAVAERTEPLPEPLEEVGVVERLDERIPLDLVFADEAGNRVTLGRYFDGERPVVLMLGYYRCRVLCNLVVHGVLDSLQDFDWSAGDQFEIVTVSIDPNETPELAAEKKTEYLASYKRESAARGWHFLTGRQEEIKALADAVGFHYRYLPEVNEFAHPAAIFVITPDGRISRYLYGVKHEPQTMRLSLVEASEGKIGSTLDQVILYCFYYDADAGSYVPAAIQIMKIGGALTLAIVVVWMAVYWAREVRRKTRTA